ncbi:hypothetical protein [Edaphocola aurantiacus]|uniref:hypothetical protein n=1 Tax=Edaphocola aurantiacus TaxID=2601682 RepID=UPI001C97EEE7|nr:hypothetical protein [Edaphocola aurantiacus]
MKYHLSISEPCTAPWDSMTPCQQGRYCGQCQKTVIDFSDMSDAAIARVVSQQQNICGRFMTDQLDRPLLSTHQTARLKWLPKVFSILLAPFLPVSAIAQQLPTTVQHTSETSGIKKVRISGTIWDSLSNTPMVGMLISTDKLGVKYSDAQGAFHFVVPEHLWHQEILFTAVYTQNSTPDAEQTTILPVKLSVNGTDTAITLERYPSDQLDPVTIYGIKLDVKTYIAGGIGVVVQRKTTIWQRIRYSISKHFKRHQ